MKLSRISIKAFYTWELPPLYSDKSATSSWPPVYSTERLFCFISKITSTSEVVFHLSESIEAAPPESFCETLPLLWGLKWYLVHITSQCILEFFSNNLIVWVSHCNCNRIPDQDFRSNSRLREKTSHDASSASHCSPPSKLVGTLIWLKKLYKTYLYSQFIKNQCEKLIYRPHRS